MTLWHKYASIAYLAVLLGVVGHASSEFVSVLCGISDPELSVWRFLLQKLRFLCLPLRYGTRRLPSFCGSEVWPLCPTLREEVIYFS